MCFGDPCHQTVASESYQSLYHGSGGKYWFRIARTALGFPSAYAELSRARDSWIDLSTVLNASEVVGTSRLRSGKYNLVRFEVLESVVTVGGQNYTATVSSGRLTIAVTGGGVNIEVGQISHLVIDITPKVIGSAAGGFRVVPAVKASPS